MTIIFSYWCRVWPHFVTFVTAKFHLWQSVCVQDRWGRNFLTDVPTTVFRSFVFSFTFKRSYWLIGGPVLYFQKTKRGWISCWLTLPIWNRCLIDCCFAYICFVSVDRSSCRPFSLWQCVRRLLFKCPVVGDWWPPFIYFFANILANFWILLFIMQGYRLSCELYEVF